LLDWPRISLPVPNYGNGTGPTLPADKNPPPLRRGNARQHPDQLDMLRALARRGRITAVFSAHDEIHNNAVALRDFLLVR
jgi:hypothetical protein